MVLRHFSTELDTAVGPVVADEAQLAAMAFLARYSGRTLDAYCHALRNLFQWAADHGLAVLEATRAHLEL
jgi:integrase/recombinase XerD